LIAELDPEHLDAPERAPISSALQAEYARLTGVAPAAVTAAMQLYLPIVRVFAAGAKAAALRSEA
jgi:hypothetical protein